MPTEKWLKRLLSYGALKIHYDKDNGNKEIWEPVCRPNLRNLDDLEILNQYNAEIRRLYNYYRIAHNATVLNNFLYVMKYSMYKTFAGKYRTSTQKIKWFQRVTARYDRLDVSFLAFVYFAAIAIFVTLEQDYTFFKQGLKVFYDYCTKQSSKN